MEVNIVSRTSELNSTDSAFTNKNEEVLLIGKDDRSIAISTPVGIKQIVSEKTLMEDIQTNINLPITNYKVNCITYQRVASANTSTAPVPNNAGVLITFRFSDDAFSYQEWKSMSSTSIWRRVWDKINNTWGVWGQ